LGERDTVADQPLDNKKKTEEPACDPKDRSRRSALKKLAIGAGVLTGYQVLPKHWTKPLIEQVVLPVHAQASGLSLTDPCETITLESGNQDSTTVIINVQGSVSPPTANVAISIVATVTGGTGESTTANTVTNSNGQYTLTGMVVKGGPGITSVNVEITAAGATGTVNCSVAVPDVSGGNSTKSTKTTTTQSPTTTSSCPCPFTVTIYNNLSVSITLSYDSCPSIIYDITIASNSNYTFTAYEDKVIMLDYETTQPHYIDNNECLETSIYQANPNSYHVQFIPMSCCLSNIINITPYT